MEWRQVYRLDSLIYTTLGGAVIAVMAMCLDTHTLGLNRLFEITKPGSYRLKFVFTNASGLGEGESKEVTFSLAPAKGSAQ